MTTLEVLEAARDLIRTPEHWCQYEPHNSCIPGKRTAHCAWGALSEVDDRELWKTGPAINALATQIPRFASEPDNAIGVVANYNDFNTHADVLELFNLAIQAELAKEKAHSRHMREEREREQAEDPTAPLAVAA